MNALARRLRRLAASGKIEEKNGEILWGIQEKPRNFGEESRNVSKKKRVVDIQNIDINHEENKVYDLLGEVRIPGWEADIGDSGGQEDGPPPGSGEAAAGRGGRSVGGQDTAPISPRRPAAGWSSGGAVQTRTPAGRADPPDAPASGETSWVEQADRAFRRDSRRYDGGFYLY